MININKRGIVSDVNGDRLEVLLTRSSACGDCSSCGGCEVKTINVDLKNDIDAKVGDFVELEYDNSIFLKSTILVYLFPLIMLIVGVAIGYIFKIGNNTGMMDLYSFLIGFILMGISYVIVHRIDNKYKDNSFISVKKVDELFE